MSASGAARPAPVLVLGLLGLGVALYLARLIGGFTYYPGSLYDARFNQAVLEHLWLWASGRAESLANPAYFYPFKDILYFSDAHFGTGWLYVGARALGAPREIAFDLWFLVGMAASFAAAFYAFRQFGFAGVSAAIGAALFAFSLPMLSQDLHAQLVYRFGVPLAILEFVRFVSRPRLRPLFLLAFWVSWQFLCSIYIGVFLVEALALMAIWALIGRKNFPILAVDASPSRAADIALGGLALAAVAAAALMLARYAETSHAYGLRRSYWEVEFLLPRWSSFVSQARSLSVGWLAAWLPHPYLGWEHQLFPGLGVLALAILGFRAREERRVAWTCVFVLAAFVVLTLDVDGYSIYYFLVDVPGLNAIRGVSRFALVAAFFVAWLATVGFDRALRSDSSAAQIAAIVALALASADIGLFSVAHEDIAAAKARISALTAGLDGAALRARGAVLFRFGEGTVDDETVRDIDLMIAAQDLGLQSFNGYSGSDPPLYKHPKSCAEAKAWIGEAEAFPNRRPGGENLIARAQPVPAAACP